MTSHTRSPHTDPLDLVIQSLSTRVSSHADHTRRDTLVDLVQDRRIEEIERAIRELRILMQEQREMLLEIVQELQPEEPVTCEPFVPCFEGRCKDWVAVEHRKNGRHNTVPLYVSGEVETPVGAGRPRLRPARSQGRDPYCLVLDLIDRNDDFPSTAEANFRAARFDQEVRPGQYSRVQINRDGVRIARFDVKEEREPAPPTPDIPKLPDGPNLEYGRTGERVRIVQQILSMIGYDITLDGEFDHETDTFVRNFQDNEDILVDGIVGPITRRHLNKVDRWWRPSKTKKTGWRALFN